MEGFRYQPELIETTEEEALVARVTAFSHKKHKEGRHKKVLKFSCLLWLDYASECGVYDMLAAREVKQ